MPRGDRHSAETIGNAGYHERDDTCQDNLGADRSEPIPDDAATVTKS